MGTPAVRQPRLPDSTDLAARRILAVGRVAVALAVTVTTSIQMVAVPEWFTWLAGLVWLPIASWIWFAEEGPRSRRRSVLGLSTDVAMIVLAMVVLPDQADVVLAASMPLAVIVAYRGGLMAGTGLVAAIVGARVALANFDLTGPVDLLVLAVEILSAALLITLVGRAVSVARRDASTARHFAQRSDVILSRSSEAILVTSAGGEVLVANPAASQSLADGDQLVGQHCSDLKLTTSDGPLDCSTGCALASLCADGADVEVIRHMGETRRPFLASASRLPGQGRGVEFVHSFRDITRLRQADEAKTMFLATASHELKTPLTVIRGFTQILRATVTDPQSQLALEAIDGRSSELVAIVDRLLLSSRIEAGRVELTPTLFDVSALLRERIVTLGNTLGRMIDLQCDNDLRAIGSADALVTALEHLLDNAAKYSPGGEPIEVRARKSDDAVCITVADHGIGMSEEEADHCFEKFWQAEATDVRRFGGTGIGLYIVHSLVRGMGGDISVRSEAGAGTTFEVSLPSTPANDTQNTASPAESSVDQFMGHLGLPAGMSR